MGISAFAATAIAAADHGLKPLILEKMPWAGGLSITSGGGLAIATDEELCFRYLKRTNLNTTSEPVLRVMAKGMVELPDYIRYLEANSAIDFKDINSVVNPDLHATYDFEGAESIISMKIASVANFNAFPHAKGLRGGARLFKLAAWCWRPEALNLMRR